MQKKHKNENAVDKRCNPQTRKTPKDRTRHPKLSTQQKLKIIKIYIILNTTPNYNKKSEIV